MKMVRKRYKALRQNITKNQLVVYYIQRKVFVALCTVSLAMDRYD
jgi:hypothetical protein